MNKRWLQALLVLGAGVAVAGASAQSSNVIITRAEAQGSHPFVAWTLAGGWCSNVIAVAKSPQTGSDGSFFFENVIDGDILRDNQTSWLSSFPSLDKPGTYYVRVHAYQCDFLEYPEWSATATIIKAPPPPPPPPPTPRVRLVVRGWSGYDYTTGPLSKVRLGQRLVIEMKATESDQFTMRANGHFCTLTRQGNRCRAYGDDALGYVTTRVSKNMVVRDDVTFSALYKNPVTLERVTVARKVLKVGARRGR